MPAGFAILTVMAVQVALAHTPAGRQVTRPPDKGAKAGPSRDAVGDPRVEPHIGDRLDASPPRVAVKPGGVKPYTVESVEGRVVWLADALAKRFGVHVVPEARERLLALESADGHLDPILENVRGRAFRGDARLRAMTVRLLVRRYRDMPLIQIVDVHEIRDGHVYAIDYWCDTCSISMFEKGLCSCCQQPNRLRERLVPEKP